MVDMPFMSRPSPKAQILALPKFSTQTLLIASVSLAVLLVAIVVFFARRKSSTRGSVVLLVGPSDAGKTAVLSTLIYEQTLPTHTSLQANASLYSPPMVKRQLRILDVPGHPRLRGQFKDHILDAKAVVFVVDTSTITRNGPAVAEHLHQILHSLTTLPPTHTLPPLLILAHKSDLLASSSVSGSNERGTLAISRVRTILERELEKRRAAQAGGVGIEGLGADSGGGGAGDSEELSGGLECRAGGAFRFAEWEGGEVGFAGTWVRLGAGGGASDSSVKSEEAEDEKRTEDGLDALREWLDDIS